MYTKLYSAQINVFDAELIKIEINFKKVKAGTPQINIIGLADKAVGESKDRVHSAIENSNFSKPENFENLKSSFAKITIALSPAETKKSGAVFDLPIALAFLETQKVLKTGAKDLFVGELSLEGKTHKIKGALSIAQMAKKYGFKRLFLPKKNAFEASFIEGLEVYGVEKLEDLIFFFQGKNTLKKEKTRSYKDFPRQKKENEACLDHIKGNKLAKRAVSIAVAGKHNLALFGPPGTGKTLLAKTAQKLLPPLNFEEALETTKIHSVKGVSHETIISEAPFRSPHHSASYTAIIGGGNNKIEAGEVSLAHNGVLFLDEFTEYDRRVINSLREPLEEKKVHISRAKGQAEFPAKFMLIIAFNPCPCGFYGTDKCTCSYQKVQNYRNKISGPIMDRIDIWVKVDEVEYEKLLNDKVSYETKCPEHQKTLKIIENARKKQEKRFMCNKYNSDMSAQDIDKYIKLDSDTKEILNSAAEKMGLSARSYHKILKISRTIADMEDSENIKQEHLLEALSFREF